MDTIDGKSASWSDGDLLESTIEPGISVSAMNGDVPTLTVTTIVGVTVVVLIAIIAVFILGVLIDCRQQRLLEKKMGEVRRLKNHRRGNMQQEGDGVSIANNMEEPGTSVPPAAAFRNIP